MATHFSFSFSGDDIEEDKHKAPAQGYVVANPEPSSTAGPASAFPVQGKPLLPPVHHDLDQMLSRLPSKIAYGMMDVDLDGKGTIRLPRRELWDVRVQLMAEEGGEGGEGGDSEHEPGLGQHDVKTGIYEGGFKSWESSVDLVKTLASEGFSDFPGLGPCRLIELGCGTALPSLALLQWASATRVSGEKTPLMLTLADYNPSVLYLVTLPNLLLAWALQSRAGTPLLEEALSSDGELELTGEVVEAFKIFLVSNQISLSFLSGGWSAEFVELLYEPEHTPSLPEDLQTLVIGAETIYSPFALASFSDTLLSLLRRERQDRPNGQAIAIVAAKRLYFGVGGSLDDFVDKMRGLGATVATLREETEGVRRGVVRCVLS
ncbi:hypothetical protein QBC33DRAFT_372535 [Phialemonium atrogriseum]|uniref:protein-histidine N-methyltransferase n=1 Tax=Phialemonium atrogriseum TaxID=1093897 RepID=A0AAJ0C1V3_9PEZI|nr:uncharacterized protein QBC33DRAFT_372535 [Phialemonium atrogriseum]KAK1768346.1 hypothetical protein QBC33DRAFT_372535 [Phialemonium atrogriseum]